MFLAAVLCAFISLAWASEEHAVPAAEATAVRIAHHGDHTRFVVDLSKEINVSFAQPIDVPSKKIVVNLGNITWSLPHISGTGAGVIHRYRYHNSVPAHIVLEMSRPAVVTKTFILSPNQPHSWRLVVDLAENDRRIRIPGVGRMGGAQLLSRDWSSLPRRVPHGNTTFFFSLNHLSEFKNIPLPPLPPVFLQKEKKHKIVLDPGHGGADPGATGVSGIFEKHITLAMALELREKLLSTNRYTVILTREDDTFVALRERVASARAHNADLFISIHADAIGTPEICGLSVYTLSEEASDQEAAALAERENRADLIGGVDLSRESRDVANILIDLVQRETINHSAQLASAFTRELRREIRLLPKTHRFAGFAVLKAPAVPAILLEMGYLSHPKEEKLLHQPGYRAQLSAAMVRAIDDYFKKRHMSPL